MTEEETEEIHDEEDCLDYPDDEPLIEDELSSYEKHVNRGDYESIS